jgi:hypothetical protein
MVEYIHLEKEGRNSNGREGDEREKDGKDEDDSDKDGREKAKEKKAKEKKTKERSTGERTREGVTTREIKKRGHQGKKEECRGRKGVRKRNVSRKEGRVQAGSAMSDNRLELKRRLTESRHKDSEATFIWQPFYGGSPKII